MKVLTVWQPWATLIAVGAKPYEFRGHTPPKSYVGQRIAIHAGARKVVQSEVKQLVVLLRSRRAWTTCLRPDLALPLLEQVLAAPDLMPLGMILCTAELGAPRDGNDIATEFGGPVNDSDRREYSQGGQDQDARDPLLALTAKQRHGLVTVEVNGQTMVITDICTRMLDPLEGARAHEFDPASLQHEIEVTDAKGKVKRRKPTKTEIGHLVGNSVPPRMVKLLAQANVHRELMVAAE